MTRAEFIKVCGGVGLSLCGLKMIQSCRSIHEINTTAKDNILVVPKKEFIVRKKEKETLRKFIVIRTNQLQHPIALFKLKQESYSAVLMSCTHQQVELSVNGNLLTCSAHGSEFSNTGEVVQGPAEQSLKKFKLTEDEQNIFIQLA